MHLEDAWSKANYTAYNLFLPVYAFPGNQTQFRHALLFELQEKGLKQTVLVQSGYLPNEFTSV